MDLRIADTFTASFALLSEVMNRKRPLSLTMIRALPAGLKIPGTVLVQESPVPTTRTRPANSRRKARRRIDPVAA